MSFQLGIIVHEDNHAHVGLGVEDPDTGEIIRMDLGCTPSVMALAAALVQAGQTCRELNQALEDAPEDKVDEVIRHYQARASADLN